MFLETFIHITPLICLKQHSCAFQPRDLKPKRDAKCSLVSSYKMAVCHLIQHVPCAYVTLNAEVWVFTDMSFCFARYLHLRLPSSSLTKHKSFFVTAAVFMANV